MNGVRENALHSRECFLGLLTGLRYLVYRKQGEIRSDLCSNVKTLGSIRKIFDLIL